MAQSSNWMFTINNPSANDIPKQWGTKFAVWQLERGEQGTLHLQGYVRFASNKRLNALKTLCPEAHWEIRKGNHEQAYEYVTKEDTRVEGPWSEGEVPKQGKRSDLESLKESVDKGLKEAELFDEHWKSMLKYYKGVKHYTFLKSKDRNFKSYVTVLHGDAGTGKSHWAHNTFPNAFHLMKGESEARLWWDGYDGQEAVIIDEFCSKMMPFIYWKKLCDAYPFNVEIKGGTVKFNSKHIIFTSNDEPSTWYRKVRDMNEKNDNAFKRRIDRIIRKTGKNSYYIEKTTDLNEQLLGSDHQHRGVPPLIEFLTEEEREDEERQLNESR